MPEHLIDLTEAEIEQVAAGIYIGAGAGIPKAATQETNPGLAVAAPHTALGIGGSSAGGQIIKESYFP